MYKVRTNVILLLFAKNSWSDALIYWKRSLLSDITRISSILCSSKLKLPKKKRKKNHHFYRQNRLCTFWSTATISSNNIHTIVHHLSRSSSTLLRLPTSDATQPRRSSFRIRYQDAHVARASTRKIQPPRRTCRGADPLSPSRMYLR